MINLLPPIEKERLFLDQVEGLVKVFGVALSVILICLIFVLLSLNFYILGESVSQKVALEQAQKQYATSEFLKYKELMQSYNTTISRVSLFYKQETKFSQAIKNILQISRPAGVKFTDFSLETDKNTSKIIVKISGGSNTRDNLLIFKNNIEAAEFIKTPVFSAESWISPADAKFLLTFTIENGK